MDSTSTAEVVENTKSQQSAFIGWLVRFIFLGTAFFLFVFFLYIINLLLSILEPGKLFSSLSTARD